MRGRKPVGLVLIYQLWLVIKKESPNEGTETDGDNIISYLHFHIKKESPNEGTETKSNVITIA